MSSEFTQPLTRWQRISTHSEPVLYWAWLFWCCKSLHPHSAIIIPLCREKMSVLSAVMWQKSPSILVVKLRLYLLALESTFFWLRILLTRCSGLSPEAAFSSLIGQSVVPRSEVWVTWSLRFGFEKRPSAWNQKWKSWILTNGISDHLFV